jgi:class 3 adenylate cyclase/serine/threonine protein kinase
MPPASRLTVLLFTDIVGSTHLKSDLGTAEYARVLDEHNDLFESACARFEGHVLKHTGDGFFASFGTASQAVRSALRFQQALRAHHWPQPLAVRVGVHIGEVAVTEMAGRADVIGVAADVAARVMSLAEGGQILLTRSAFNDARQFVNDPALKWVAHGPYLFKGIDEPVEVFEVGVEGASPLTAPAGGDKGRRVVAHDQEMTLGWRPAVGLEIPGRGGWQLERKLGEGGFGEVWLGQHERTRQRRVFKFCFDAERLRSFKRELTLFRLLRDVLGDRPDIAKLHEVKLDEQPYFLESEYTDGGNLTEWSSRKGGIGKIPLATRLQIVAQVADAVAAAHSAGVLHKDIKPSNILIHTERDGRLQPRLADFGIGLLADRSQLAARQITESGFTVVTEDDSSRTGTRLYAPPELLEGKGFTAQGDIFALGVLLYQVVVGDLSRSLAVGWERNVSDARLRGHIAACVDGEPARRLPDARELSARLRGLESQPVEALETDEAARPSADPIPLWWKVAMSVCVTLAVIVLIGAILARRNTPAALAPSQSPPPAVAAKHADAQQPLAILISAQNPAAPWQVKMNIDIVAKSADDLTVVFEILAARDCDIIVLSQDSQGRVTLLVPNPIMPSVRARAGTLLRLPSDPTAEFPLLPPYGEDHFKVIATTRPLKLSGETIIFADTDEPFASPDNMLKTDEWATSEARIVTNKDGRPIVVR